MYRSVPGGPTTPVTHMRVKSLLVPPGIPDFYTRQRMVEAGPIAALRPRLVRRRRAHRPRRGRHRRRLARGHAGRAARASSPGAAGASRGTRSPASTSFACRATDANGETQPLEPRWDTGGFGNNVVQRVQVTVR